MASIPENLHIVITGEFKGVADKVDEAHEVSPSITGFGPRPKPRPWAVWTALAVTPLVALFSAWVIQRVWMWHLTDVLPFEVWSVPEVWAVVFIVTWIVKPIDFDDTDVAPWKAVGGTLFLALYLLGVAAALPQG